MKKDYIKETKGIINADLYSGEILERAKEAAEIPDKNYIGEIKTASRCKKGSRKKGRK